MSMETDRLLALIEERLDAAIDENTKKCAGGLEHDEYMKTVGRIKGLKDARDAVRDAEETLRLEEESDDDD